MPARFFVSLNLERLQNDFVDLFHVPVENARGEQENEGARKPDVGNALETEIVLVVKKKTGLRTAVSGNRDLSSIDQFDTLRR